MLFSAHKRPDWMSPRSTVRQYRKQFIVFCSNIEDDMVGGVTKFWFSPVEHWHLPIRKRFSNETNMTSFGQHLVIAPCLAEMTEVAGRNVQRANRILCTHQHNARTANVERTCTMQLLFFDDNMNRNKQIYDLPFSSFLFGKHDIFGAKCNTRRNKTICL